MLVRGLTSSGGGGNKSYDHHGTLSNSRIECGFQPRIIILYDDDYSSSHYKVSVLYNSDISSNYEFQLNGTVYSNRTIGGSGEQLGGVDATGFDLSYYNNYSSGLQIIAIE